MASPCLGEYRHGHGCPAPLEIIRCGPGQSSHDLALGCHNADRTAKPKYTVTETASQVMDTDGDSHP